VLQYDAQYYYSPAPEYDMRSGEMIIHVTFMMVFVCWHWQCYSIVFYLHNANVQHSSLFSYFFLCISSILEWLL